MQQVTRLTSKLEEEAGLVLRARGLARTSAKSFLCVCPTLCLISLPVTAQLWTDTGSGLYPWPVPLAGLGCSQRSRRQGEAGSLLEKKRERVTEPPSVLNILLGGVSGKNSA